MKSLLSVMRPAHWSKNIFVFVGLIFGGRLFGPAKEVLFAVVSTVGGFACFSLAASCIYILNDIIDRNADKMHPEKRNRPIASGSITIHSAVILAFVCAVVAIVGSFRLAWNFGLIILAYIGLMILYSGLFKKVMILDCVVLAVGFCLRAIAGAVLVNVFISPWLIICTFALSLFLSFGKRRSEIAQLGVNSTSFRRTLAGYTPELLAHMLDVSSGLAIVCFLLYAMDDRTFRVFGTNNLVYTTPLVLYCIFRFSALIQKGRYLSPVELTLYDRPFQAGFLLWIVACIAIIYADRFRQIFQ